MCLAGGLEVTLKCELMKQPQFSILNDTLKPLIVIVYATPILQFFNFALKVDMIIDGIVCIMIMNHDL